MSTRGKAILNSLDEFSRSFAAALFDAAPELVPHASAIEGILSVSLSPVPPRERCVLRVTTDNEEITVGFGLYHSHFDWPSTPEIGPLGDPIHFTRSVMADETLIVDWTLDGEWAQSSTLPVG